MKSKLVIIYICFPFLFLSAQSKLDSLSWLEGAWTGEKWGGTVEEYWGPPTGDVIIGMFILINNGKVQFTEHWMIGEFDGKLALRLRHFNPDFTAWEEKDEYLEFEFVEMGENYIQFKGLRYEITDSGILRVSLKMKQKEEIVTEIFDFKKM